MNLIGKPYISDLQKLKELKAGESINLVLGSGSHKGVAHIALIEKLEEMNINIKSISGCSTGALVGSMYASGIRPQEILKFFQETDLLQFSWLTYSLPGIFDAYNYKKFLKGTIKDTFEELNIPLYVNATNMEQGHNRYFNSGDLIDPVLASCTIPGIFNPILIDGELYSDGAVMNGFPLAPLKQFEGKIIGSFLHYPSTPTKKELNTTLKVIKHSRKLAYLAKEEYKFHDTFLTICFPVEHLSSYRNKVVNKIYKVSKAYLENI